MSKKISAYFFSEGQGMYTKGTYVKEEAVAAMQKEAWGEYKVDEDFERVYKFHPREIHNLSVVESRYYRCMDCGIDTIGDGDNMCFECGKDIGDGRGRKCFAFFPIR